MVESFQESLICGKENLIYAPDAGFFLKSIKKRNSSEME